MHQALFFAHRFIELLLEKRIEVEQVVLDKNFLPYVDLKLVLTNKLDENRVLRLEQRFNSDNEKDDVRVNIHFINPGQVDNGILLWGRPVKVTAASKELDEKRIITYDTTGLPQVKRAELVRRLFGYKTKKSFKEKEKVYEFESMLKKLGGKRLRNAIMVDEKDAHFVQNILEDYDIPVKSNNVFTDNNVEFVEK